MGDRENEDSIQVPVVWAGVEDVPILYANTFISQFDPAATGGFIVTIGQLTPPALIGTPDQVREQAEQVSFVPVRAVARIAMTRSKLDELIALLQLNRDQFDEATRIRGDPRT
jgi:hypothetical protein